MSVIIIGFVPISIIRTEKPRFYWWFSVSSKMASQSQKFEVLTKKFLQKTILLPPIYIKIDALYVFLLLLSTKFVRREDSKNKKPHY